MKKYEKKIEIEKKRTLTRQHFRRYIWADQDHSESTDPFRSHYEDCPSILSCLPHINNSSGTMIQRMHKQQRKLL